MEAVGLLPERPAEAQVAVQDEHVRAKGVDSGELDRAIREAAREVKAEREGRRRGAIAERRSTERRG